MICDIHVILAEFMQYYLLCQRSSTAIANAVLLLFLTLLILDRGGIVLFFKLGVTKDRNRILPAHFLSASYLRIYWMNQKNCRTQKVRSFSFVL